MVDALQKAGTRETGGILMGEHITHNTFRVLDITVQRQLGTFASFIRAISGITLALSRFFRRTNYVYPRFNYLGEWHSHPSFVLKPSSSDCEAMLQIVNDSAVAANFAVLVIVRLQGHNLQGAAFIFMPGGIPRQAILVFEEIRS
jgi:hypothetical protein